VASVWPRLGSTSDLHVYRAARRFSIDVTGATELLVKAEFAEPNPNGTDGSTGLQAGMRLAEPLGMSLRIALALSIVVCSCAVAAKSSAESARPAADSAPAETPAAPRRWYGWQTLSLDGASLTLGVVGVAGSGEPRATRIVLGSVGFTGYALGAPVVHWMHDQPGKAATSLGLRLGLPLAAAGVVSALSAGRCPDAIEHEGDDYCRRIDKTMAIVGGLAMLAAAAFDASALSWEPEARRHQLALAPVLGWDGARGGLAGMAGTF
jgi:hypothetical protein